MKTIALPILTSILLASSNVIALENTLNSERNVNHYPDYLEGKSYKGGDVVKNDGELYRCMSGVTESWCSGVAWAYAPGKGTAWMDAWEKVIESDLVTTPPPNKYPQYSEGTVYKSGDIVFNLGRHFRCKSGPTVPWCSGIGWAYAPGTGNAWEQAWEIVPESEINPPIVPSKYTITAFSLGNGNIEPKSVQVSAGESQDFLVTPESGYSLISIDGCNGSLSSNVYTVKHTVADCEIKARFANNVELAVNNGNHSYTTTSELLTAMRDEAIVFGDRAHNVVEKIYAESNATISWEPSKVSVYIDDYNPEFTVPILISNIDRSSNPSEKTLMTLSEKNAHRFGFVGSNLFTPSDNDTNSILKNTFSWLTNKNISNDSQIKIVISQTHASHYKEIKSWLNSHYPNATFNSFERCDYENINTCVNEINADLVIFGGFDRDKRGQSQTDNQLQKLIDKKIPLFISFTFSHAKQPMLTKLLEHGDFDYASNYRLGAKLNSYSVDDLKTALKQRPKYISALLRYIDSLEKGDFDPQITLLCGNFLVCINNTTGALNSSDFSVSTQWLRKNAIKLDLAGVNVFSLSTHRLLKLALLLADKYRLTIDYPIYPDEIQEWQRAAYADSVISYARHNNVAQPDLGDFIKDRFSLNKGEGTPYSTPDKLTERKKISVPFNNQWTATGWYALPGEAITLTRHDSGDHNVEIIFNFRRPNANRMMDTKVYLAPMGISELSYVQRRMKLKAGDSLTMSTPYGGPIYLLFTNGDSDMSVDITASNITHHPYIDNINSADEMARFMKLLNETELPHIDVKFNGYEQHLRKDRLLNGINDTYSSIESLLAGARDEHMDVLYSLAGFKVLGKSLIESFTQKYLNICYSLFGSDCLDEHLHTRPFIQHANYDQNANCGSGCGGNPFDSGQPLNPRGWLDNHELGHGLQRRSLELNYVEEENKNKWRSYQIRSGESQNNVFALNQRWNYHYNTDKRTDFISTPYNDKDLFFAFMSDVNKITNESGERVVFNANCSTFANAKAQNRYSASWSMNKDAHYPLHIYIQIILHAHKLEMPNGDTLDSGFDIFTLLHQHVRLFEHYAKNEGSWVANRERLGFEDFSFDGESLYEGLKVSHMPGNDFILVSLNFMTKRDWSTLFDLAGLRYSDKAKQQAKKHATRGEIPLGMYVQDKKYPGVNLSEDLIFLPLNHKDKTTRWPIDNSSPVDCL